MQPECRKGLRRKAERSRYRAPDRLTRVTRVAATYPHASRRNATRARATSEANDSRTRARLEVTRDGLDVRVLDLELA